MPCADCVQTKCAADFTKLRISRTKNYFFPKEMYRSDLQLRPLEHCSTRAEFEQDLGVFTDSKLHFYHAIYIFSHFIQFPVLSTIYKFIFLPSSIQLCFALDPPLIGNVFLLRLMPKYWNTSCEFFQLSGYFFSSHAFVVMLKHWKT